MTSTGSGDSAPDLAGYYPAWLDDLAEDVTLEGSMMDGYVQGPEAVRTVLVHIRSLYDYQDFHAVGPFGDNGWFEDYTAGVRGKPIKNYRPRSTLLLLSRLIGEKFAGTPIGEHFLAGDA